MYANACQNQLKAQRWTWVGLKLCIFSYLSVKTFVVRAEKNNAVL